MRWLASWAVGTLLVFGPSAVATAQSPAAPAAAEAAADAEHGALPPPDGSTEQRRALARALFGEGLAFADAGDFADADAVAGWRAKWRA